MDEALVDFIRKLKQTISVKPFIKFLLQEDGCIYSYGMVRFTTCIIVSSLAGRGLYSNAKLAIT